MTNLYLSGLMDRHLIALPRVLAAQNIEPKFLSSTQDIWCRDYMPIVRPDVKLVQFRFEPTYLKGYEHLQSDPAEVCPANGIAVDMASHINLDGGNVLIRGNKALISDRIFVENPGVEESALVQELETTLGVTVLLVPAMHPATDLTGHADGMIRWVDDITVVVGDLTVGPKKWQQDMTTFLKRSGLKVEFLPAFWSKVHGNHNAVGCYVNFLELSDRILMPTFELPDTTDALALRKLEALFPNREIVPVPCLELAKGGGVLNCVTWSGTV